MANLFRGFKQVTSDAYASATTEDKIGYIWFVRTEMADKKVAEGEQPDPLLNDSYDIYFGTKHYGHFMDGEIELMATGLENIKAAVGLDGNYGFIPSPAGLVDALDKKFENTKGKHTVKEAIELLYSSFEDFKNTVNSKIDKRAVDVVYTKSDQELGGDSKGHASLKLKMADNSFSTPIDIQDFIVDGLLDKAELVTVDEALNETGGEKPGKAPEGTAAGTYIKLTFLQEGKGKGKKAIYLNVNGLIDVYTCEDGSILVNGNKVSVAKVTTDKSFVSKNIPVAGGPLANLKGVSDKFPDGIPTTMSMEELLKTLFCEEQYPTLHLDDGSITTSFEKDPSISFTPSEGTVEVGTEISVRATGNETKVTTSPRKAYGFTNGYATDTLGGGYVNASSKSAEESGKEIIAYGKLAASGKLKNESVKDQSNTTAAPISGTFKVGKGDNVVTVTDTANQYHVTYGTLPELFAKSNLGNYSDTDKTKTAAKNSSITLDSNVATKAASKTVTGDYKYFEGYASAVPASKEDIIALNHKTGWCGSGINITGKPLGTCPAQQIHCIAVPANMNIVSIFNGMDLESKDSYKTSGNIVYTLANNDNVNYHVFYQPVAADFKYNKIEIK